MTSQLIIVIIPILFILFWLWAFQDMQKNEFIPDYAPMRGLVWPPQAKNQWVFYFLLFGMLTPFMYWFMRPR